MTSLLGLIVFIVVLQLFVEDDAFPVFAKLAVLLYCLQWFFTGVSYIWQLFRIG